MRQKFLWIALFSAAWVAVASAPVTAQTGAAEVEFWQSVKDTENAAELEAYLQAYPDGQFAPLAKLRIKKLATGAGASPKSGIEPANPAASNQGKTTASSAPPVHDCDRLAAHPFDAAKVAEGLQIEYVDAKRAIAACESALEIYSGIPRFHFQLGRGLEKNKSYGEAMVQYQKAAELGYPRAMNNIGLLYAEGMGVARDWAEAVKWFRKGANKGDAAAVGYICLAHIRGWGVSKDYNLAISKCSEAIRRDPNIFFNYLYRGYAYGAKGQYDRAIADHSEAILLDPKYARSYYIRGNTYRDMGDSERALADYTEAIKFDASYVHSYSNRAVVYEKLGRKADAIADYRKALLLNPADEFAQKGLIRLGAKPF